ncbi:MAG: hypothetical protein Q4G39_07980 [Brachymonas sp.]|nr:hypothetical protein [Brachymonas sp.]
MASNAGSLDASCASLPGRRWGGLRFHQLMGDISLFGLRPIYKLPGINTCRTKWFFTLPATQAAFVFTLFFS